MRLKEKNLALFFTLDISMKLWHEIGIIKREVAIYNKLSSSFKNIYFFTYGNMEDLNSKNYLNDNIIIIPKPIIFCSENFSNIFNLLYSIIFPLFNFNIFKKVDFLKTNQMRGAWAALLIKIFYRKKLIVRTGYIWSIFYKNSGRYKLKLKLIKFLEKHVYRNADAIISSSKNDNNYIKENYKPKSNITFIPNYIDTERFIPLDIKKKKKSICFVGRLEKQKNLDELLNALDGLSFSLTIIGDGSLRSKLEKKADDLRLKINFLGVKSNDDLPYLLNQHEVFILPSLYEGMPKALLEAMSCGLPVIGTDVKGINEVIVNNYNGILCKTDYLSIKNCIINIMDNDDLKNRLGENARKTIIDNYSLENLIYKEIRLYESFNTIQKI